MREQNSNLTELYRDRAMIQALALEIGKVCAGPLTVMEVCGTHTMRIHQYGIKNLLPPQIHLLSWNRDVQSVSPTLGPYLKPWPWRRSLV